MHCEGGHDPAELDRLEALRLRPRALAAAQPVLRRRGRRRVPRGRHARRRRRPAPRRPRRRGRMSERRRPPSRARRRGRARRGSARAVGAEPGRWLISTSRWRSAADERRYLRAMRRSRTPRSSSPRPPDGDRRPALARARPAPRELPRRRPRPDGRREPPPPRHRPRAARGGGRWAREAGVSKLELHVFPHNEPAIALYERLRLRPRGLPPRPLPPGRRARRRDPDGLRGDAYLTSAMSGLDQLIGLRARSPSS